MKYYGRAEEVTLAVVEKFKAGEVGQPLADVFIKNAPGSPSMAWSPRNRLIMHLVGRTHDARGFKQWQEVGRKVKKGTHAFHILGPVTRNVKVEDDNGKEITVSRLFGFKSVSVHAIHDTEIFDQEAWDASSFEDEAVSRFLEELPLREVARKWDLELEAYSGKSTRARGWYSRNKTIALGVENLSTWTHELIHAADDKNGKLPVILQGVEKQQAEVVAELGGAVLLLMLGYEAEADTGGAWQYIQNWSGGDEDKAVSMCMEVIGRICEAVDLVMKESENIKSLKEAA